VQHGRHPMDYKSLLSVATSTRQLDATVAAAAAFAIKMDAHLDVLALGVDRTQVGYSFIGSGAVVLPIDLERAEEDAHAISDAVTAAITEQSPTLRWSCETAVSQIGALTDLVAQRARYADLVILSQPFGASCGPEAEAVVEAALFEGDAPVLVLPDNGKLAETPKSIVIAWNQSREAMASVRRAMPLLKAAARVDITVIDPPVYGTERSDPGGLLCQMLVRHGVKAEVSVLARSLPRVSDVLLRHAMDQGADMLVMGAYGHSRLREAILGGATRDILEAARLPVFMTH
jgi:nucleotide-binding universal stress UspA family protein